MIYIRVTIIWYPMSLSRTELLVDLAYGVAFGIGALVSYVIITINSSRVSM